MVNQKLKVPACSVWRKSGGVLGSPKGAQYVWRSGVLSLKARLIGLPLKIVLIGAQQNSSERISKPE